MSRLSAGVRIRPQKIMPHRLGDRRELPVHPAVGLAALARIVGPQRAGGILRREIAHAALLSQITRPPSSIVGTTPLGFMSRYHFWSLPPNAMPTFSRSYCDAAFVGAPQHLHDIDRIGASPDLHRLFSSNPVTPSVAEGSPLVGDETRGPSTLASLRCGMRGLGVRVSSAPPPSWADAGVDDQRHRERRGALHHLAGDRPWSCRSPCRAPRTAARRAPAAACGP